MLHQFAHRRKLVFNCQMQLSLLILFPLWKRQKSPPQLPFSTLEQLRNAVDNIASLNRPWYEVTLSGGEPTIHPHIFELMSMLHETLKERLNRVYIITNGSRNNLLYRKILDLAKSIKILMIISIHTDHVEIDHILKLIEDLSGDIEMHFVLMFNPDKREMVHEIYEAMFECRKKFRFNMNVVTLRDDDRVDPRYTPDDFAWQKKAVKQFNELVKSVSSRFPALKQAKYSNPIIRIMEDNGEIKIIKNRNRTLDLADGLMKFKGMFCIAHSSVLRIEENGRCRGMVCGDDKTICNIYDKNCFQVIRDKLIHPVKCTHYICGCAANDVIPKFASEKDAKKYVEFAKKRQAELFSEYDAAHSFKII